MLSFRNSFMSRRIHCVPFCHSEGEKRPKNLVCLHLRSFVSLRMTAWSKLDSSLTLRMTLSPIFRLIFLVYVSSINQPKILIFLPPQISIKNFWLFYTSIYNRHIENLHYIKINMAKRKVNVVSNELDQAPKTREAG